MQFHHSTKAVEQGRNDTEPDTDSFIAAEKHNN